MGIETIIHDNTLLEIRLSRPGKKNALTLDMYSGLIEQLDAAAASEEINVVMLSGAGDSFCAGNDIADFLAGGDNPDSLSDVVRFLHTLVDFPKPLLAAVQGDAVGIGTTMLLHCDLVIAADDLRCYLPFTRLGLVPEGGSSLLLPGVLGQRKTFELLIEGNPFDAQCAQDAGIVNQIVPREQLEQTALKRAHALSQLPTEALKLSKQLVRDLQREQLHTVIDQEAKLFAERLASSEARVAFSNFLKAG
ncbi:enoyl-CoA hydratase-related protein [Marinobacterium maritimum]|uniref:Enoyl-CoA hydratase-related protein n=1 Tax=Marinobacterium maritimum TaxID=500162 RepID=A0ABP3TDG6_9GAMM